MAPKHAATLPPPKAPPPASSSSEDEETTSSSSSPPPPAKRNSKTPRKAKVATSPASVHQPKDQQSSSEDDGDSSDNETPSKFTIEPSKPTADSESDSPLPRRKPKTVKPISTKPMEPKSSGAGAQSNPKKSSASATPAKRAFSGSDDEEPAAKKQLFQRVWSEEDETNILKGMLLYMKKGKEPVSDMTGFFNFIKKSLQVDCKQPQLANKVRRLKKKFETSLKRVKKGKEPSFSKPQEKIAFELSQKIWGSKPEEADNGDEATVKDNGNVKESAMSNGKAGSGARGGRKALTNTQSPAVESPGGREEPSELLDLFLKETGLCENLVKKGLSLMDASKVAEYEEKWKQMKIMEMEMRMKRAYLVKCQIEEILEALKGSKSQKW